MRILPLLLALLVGVAGWPAAAARAELPDSQPGIDAPELARLGPYPVGVRTLTLTMPAAPDVEALNGKARAAPVRARRLTVEIWYPARPGKGAAVVYADALPSEAPGQSAAFTVQGLARREATADRRQAWPLVVMSHGYSGTPVAMSWLAENLASKGYVVVGPHHRDPRITDASSFGGVAYQRPLDIAFTAHEIQARVAAGDPFLKGLVDPGRVALAGYSMGGYGVLTVAGAALSPTAAAAVRGGYLTPYARGGGKAGDLRIEGLRAVVAISPAGAGGFEAWGAEGLAGLRAPLLLIAGDQDRVVGYQPGVRSIFEAAVNAPRYLLVFKDGGHSIGMNAAPPQMRAKLWDQDWFEDPVWRKSRVVGVNLHVITAFLDLYVKGDGGKTAYLDVIPNSDDGAWPQPAPGAAYDAYSPGTGAITVWKGFQRTHSAGLELLHRDAAGR